MWVRHWRSFFFRTYLDREIQQWQLCILLVVRAACILVHFTSRRANLSTFIRSDRDWRGVSTKETESGGKHGLLSTPDLSRYQNSDSSHAVLLIQLKIYRRTSHTSDATYTGCRERNASRSILHPILSFRELTKFLLVRLINLISGIIELRCKEFWQWELQDKRVKKI